MKNHNAAYWKKRFQALENSQYQKTTVYYKDIQEQFRRATNDIQMDIEKWYRRLADNNEISLAAAKKLLKKSELEEFHWTVEEYIKYGEENALNERWMKQLENASAKVHISRLEAMKLQMQQHAELLFAEYERGITDFLHKSFEDNYYHTAFELAKGTEIGTNLYKIDTRKIDTILKQPWAADGSNFSERIWKNKGYLVNNLHTELTQSIIRGTTPQQAIDNLANQMNVSKKQAGRLLMTESAAISAAADYQCYRELEIEKYEILATLDNLTSKICQEMDGRVFELKDYEIGLTAPPFHPNCRSTTIPYFEDEFTKEEERAARDEGTGITYYVPASMKYKEWVETYVGGINKKKELQVGEYLIKNYKPGQNTTQERLVVNEAISSVPLKVQKAIHNGTIVEVGKQGASQYDYNHDILSVAKGSKKEEIIHEIGHLVENKMMDSNIVSKLRKEIIGEVDIWDIKTQTYYDNADNAVEIFLIENLFFISEYQGRIYTDNIFEAFDKNGNFRDDLLWEFISEAFREYIEKPINLANHSPKIYQLIKDVVE